MTRRTGRSAGSSHATCGVYVSVMYVRACVCVGEVRLCVCVSEKSEMAGEFQIIDANERDDSQDDAYWAQYRQHVVSADRQQVWDALLYTFNKYLCVLPATHAAATTAATRNGPCFKFSLLLSLARWQQRHLHSSLSLSLPFLSFTSLPVLLSCHQNPARKSGERC